MADGWLQDLPPLLVAVGLIVAAAAAAKALGPARPHQTGPARLIGAEPLEKVGRSPRSAGLAASSTRSSPARSSSRPRPAWRAGFSRSTWSPRARAGSRPWSCSGRWASWGAAMGPPGRGCTRSGARWSCRGASRSATGSRPMRPWSAARGPASPAAALRARRWSPARSRAWRGQARGRRLGRLRLQAVRDASASSLVGFLSQNVLRPADVATDGWSGYRGLVAAGYAHQPIPLARSWGDATLRLPAIHLVFGLAKRWLLAPVHYWDTVIR